MRRLPGFAAVHAVCSVRVEQCGHAGRSRGHAPRTTVTPSADEAFAVRVAQCGNEGGDAVPLGARRLVVIQRAATLRRSHEKRDLDPTARRGLLHGPSREP